MSKIIIRNGLILSPWQTLMGDVLIDGEKIAGITAPNAVQWPNAREIDASECYVMPGVVDAHTHIQLDTGVFQTDDDWEIGTRSAAYGGVTTVVDFATQFPGTSFREALDARLAECEPAYIDYGLHMMVTDLTHDPTQARLNLAELREMGISSIKLYTTYKPNYYADDGTIRHILEAMPDDMLAMFHCENDDLIASAIERLSEQGQTSWRYHGQARPAIAETEAVQRVLNLRPAGKAVYIVHCSDADSAAAIEHYQHQHPDAPVYYETCIQYLLLDAKLYAEHSHPEHFILQPPLRDNPSRLWPFAEQGNMAVLSTDHCDYSLAKKTAKNDFRVTAGGLPGLETLLPLSVTLFGANLQRMVEMLCTNPAKIFGLFPRKGILAPGSDADVVIYDARDSVTLSAENLHTIGGYTPYAGRTVQGRVRTTISRGDVILDENQFHAKRGRGQFIGDYQHA